jgi:OPA family sugar phosphate sensor protein UhpC-like MFS transporter
MALFNFLKPAPYLPEIENQEEVKKKYNYWRIRVFYSMFMGYSFYYLTRKSLTYAVPTMMQELHFDKAQIGLLASTWAIAYGFSKFISGIIGDRSNARTFMAFGLMVTGLCNIAFSFCSSIALFIIIWGLNGWFQGFGWPACARLLTHWYSQSERGRWWGFWNTSHNVGSAIIPIITACIAQFFGWRIAMFFPGVMSIGMGFILLNRLCDTPQSLGLPSIEQFRNDYSTKTKEKEHELSVREILFQYVLTNPYIWILAVSYFFIYVIRTGMNEWTALYLIESKGYSQIRASTVVFWLDIGGMFGSLAAGYLSDKLFSSRRGPITAIYSLCISLSFLLLWFCPASTQLADSALILILGFFIYGPQMMIGMAAAELSHKKAAATASGFCGWVAYLGAAFAGYPLGVIAQKYGWQGFFAALTCCSVIATLLLLPLWRVKSREDTVFKKESGNVKTG